MKLSIALALALFAAACGGKSKSTDTTTPPDTNAKIAADACCCDFVEETMIGDGSEDTAENQVYRAMSGKECEEQSGTCVEDKSQCEPGSNQPPEEEETVGD